MSTPDELLTGYETKLQDFMKGTAVDEYKKYCEEHLVELISSSVEPVSMKLSDIPYSRLFSCGFNFRTAGAGRN